MTWVAVLLAVLLVLSEVRNMVERRWWANRVIARHAPDLAAIEKPPRRHRPKAKPDTEPAHPTRLSQMAD